jgi:DNA repair exonuclease SbcCD ATPase subunit
MKVLEFSYKNILSYGNLLQTFKFKEGPQLITVNGENGAGKSSIKEALTVAIYGRSAIRKMKDIPNWINKNAYTNIKFITSSGDQVEIDRGVEPNFSDIRINGAHYNLPDKRKVDEFIEDELAKIPFPVFCNTISLSFDDFKSFVNLSQGDKRKIVDRIFGIDILSEMRTSVKEDLKTGKKELELINAQLEKNKTTLSSSLTHLSQLKEKLLKKRDLESDSLTTSIEEKKIARTGAQEKYTSIKSQIGELQTRINTIRDEIQSVRGSLDSLAEKLDLYQKNRCPHCLNDLTSETSLQTKEAIINKKKIFDVKLPQLKTLFTELTADLTALTDSQNLSKNEYFRLNAEIEQLEKNLKQMLSDVESDQTDSITAIISSIRSEIQNDEDSITSKNEEVTLFSVLDDLLSDSGIKKTLIDKIIPTLNSRILEISKKLEFKFQFEFDSDFNPIISYLGMQISAESLSSGQRKKMNLIVLLAFIEIIKMKHNQMNFMFLDEIFSSLDKNNVYKAIEILREYATQYNMTIFVVSHETLPEELFDQHIFVKSVNHFSEMTISDTTQSS